MIKSYHSYQCNTKLYKTLLQNIWKFRSHGYQRASLHNRYSTNAYYEKTNWITDMNQLSRPTLRANITYYPCLCGFLLHGSSSPRRWVGGQVVGSDTAGIHDPLPRICWRRAPRISEGFPWSQPYCKNRWKATETLDINGAYMVVQVFIKFTSGLVYFDVFAVK